MVVGGFCHQGCQIWPPIGPDWHQMGQIWDFLYFSVHFVSPKNLRFVLIGNILGQNLTSLSTTTDTVTVSMLTRNNTLCARNLEVMMTQTHTHDTRQCSMCDVMTYGLVREVCRE